MKHTVLAVYRVIKPYSVPVPRVFTVHIINITKSPYIETLSVTDVCSRYYFIYIFFARAVVPPRFFVFFFFFAFEHVRSAERIMLLYKILFHYNNPTRITRLCSRLKSRPLRYARDHDLWPLRIGRRSGGGSTGPPRAQSFSNDSHNTVRRIKKLFHDDDNT